MKNLKQKWGAFAEVVFGPGSALFSLLAVASLVTAFFFKDNTLFATLLSVLGSVLAGIAGSFIKDDYTRLATENVLEKKGRSALRNLEAIREQIVQIRKWIESFKNVGKEGKRALEETDRHLSTIMLNIQAGLADWVDIVPELQERVEFAKKEKEVLRAYFEELLENKKELVISKDEKRASELKKKISDLERQIKDIRKKDPWSGGSVITTSGIGYGGGTVFNPTDFGGSTMRTCSRCGRLLNANDALIDSLCSECRRGNGGTIASLSK